MEFEKLLGGNVNNGIVKKGDIVYRSGNWNHCVHEFLLYMEGKSFPGIPRFLGIDENNREMLSFIPGEVPGNSFPECGDYIWSDDNVKAIGGFLRRYHDASASFLPRALEMRWTSHLFRPEECEVICHNDAAPYNFVFRDGIAAGLIDFDTAYPAPRIWDIAYTLYTMVPLASYQPAGNGSTRPYVKSDAEQRKRRIGLFFDAYGIPLPDNMFIHVERRLRELCGLIRREADKGNAAFKKMADTGEIVYYQNEIMFLQERCVEWEI